MVKRKYTTTDNTDSFCIKSVVKNVNTHMNKNITVSTLGLGYIGLPTSALVAASGIRVNGMDVNKSVVETINRGEIHIVEPDLKGYVSTSVEKGLLKAYDTVQPADVYLVVVPTPFKGNHEPDISFVEAATRNTIPLLKKGDLFIIESTSPVGTTEKMMELIFNERPDLKGEIFLAYCPERVLPGNVIHELVHNDRVIGGVDEASTQKAIDFYSQFVKGELHKTNARTAEMCKLTENASRDVQIAFANELSLICDKADINVWDLIKLANKHPRVNILQPGCGVGGHCIAVDPYFIVSDYPLESQIIGKAREINNYKSFWVAEKIQNARLEFQLKHGRKASVAIMGLAFKPNIDDLRESPAKYIAQKVLQNSNNEEIYFVEPNIKEHKVFKLTDYKEAYEKADIVAFLVAHDEFKTLNLSKGATDRVVLDFCGIK
ncbi:UDP-N-acetyl-D-mannosaminuronic acid dehydrogenase [Alkalitalea saponilacus]|uniref:UDP-N-acetyl-D-mannosaminuronic acid dehydrogenase n=2 Tax=Alkalitalea saponilacus TaxID=889453 RepID=A0A1T5FJB5_9BACT|nr:UDP-N-acetyl-D-mannosaminuronic acid dehydrogenase [Alkalitalea saponilacus]